MLTHEGPTVRYNSSIAASPSNSDNKRSGIKFFHYELDASNRTTSLAKRDTTRLMNQCTEYRKQGYVFHSSSCNRHNLQALIVFCQDPHGGTERPISQSCGPNELCVDTGLSISGAKAYCVNTQNFRHIANLDRRTSATSLSLPVPTVDPPFAATALLADQYRRQPFIDASSFNLTALRQHDDTEDILGRRGHDHVYHLKMQPLPQGTNLLRAAVEVRGAEAGFLYLNTIS